jgi:serine/threonine protein kinase
MAPEIYKSKETAIYNDKCDIFSLGVILHELVYKKHPYNKEVNRLENNKRIQVKNKHDLVESFLEKALDHNPETRIDWKTLLKHPLIV